MLALMRLYIVRHAEAAPGSPDELRALTPHGHEQARELGRRLRDEGVRPVEILEGYRARDGGRVEVLGFDPQRSERSFRERIGVVLQQSAMFPNLTVRETHALFAGYYERPRDVDEVIRLVGLDAKRDTRVR